MNKEIIMEREYYVNFGYIGNAAETAKYLQWISSTFFGEAASKRSCKQREVTWYSPTYLTLQLVNRHYGVFYRFSEDEFNLFYLPLADKIKSWHYVDEIDALVAKMGVLCDEYRLQNNQ